MQTAIPLCAGKYHSELMYKCSKFKPTHALKWYQRTPVISIDLCMLILNQVLFSPFAHVLPKQPVGLASLLGNPWTLLSSPSFPVAAVACDEAKTLTFIVIPAGKLPGCPKKSDVARKGWFIWFHLFMLGWLILSAQYKEEVVWMVQITNRKAGRSLLGKTYSESFRKQRKQHLLRLDFIFSRSKSCRPNGRIPDPENGRRPNTVYMSWRQVWFHCSRTFWISWNASNSMKILLSLQLVQVIRDGLFKNPYIWSIIHIYTINIIYLSVVNHGNSSHWHESASGVLLLDVITSSSNKFIPWVKA